MIGKNHIRKRVFWPVFILLLLTIVLNLFDKSNFSVVVTGINTWILTYFHSVFSLAVLLMCLTCGVLFFSKIGNVRIGGEKAKPILTRWQWFSITLCTTIATGILFWGTAEPIYHLGSPPTSLNIDVNSKEAAKFSMSTLFFHWSFMPYAIYTVAIVAFALAFYNLKRSYSIGSSVLFKRDLNNAPLFSSVVDSICLFALVAGMAASLGTGILTISGGLAELFRIPNNNVSHFLVAVFIILAFVISASTGLLKGIKWLSVINVYLFIFLALIFLIRIFSREWLELVWYSLGDFMVNFIDKSLFTLKHPEDQWGLDWTIFNWANWMAWAPVTAVFLGRISVGYKVREVLIFNWIIPSLFAIVWMSIFGGSAILEQITGGSDLIIMLKESGPESIIYKLLHDIPFHSLVSIIFVITMFISFVTAADSNTEAMSALSTRGFGFLAEKSPVWLKIIWGGIIGATAFIMISFAGVKGVKIISTIGGFVSLILLIVINAGLIWFAVTFKRRTRIME